MYYKNEILDSEKMIAFSWSSDNKLIYEHAHMLKKLIYVFCFDCNNTLG